MCPFDHTTFSRAVRASGNAAVRASLRTSSDFLARMRTSHIHSHKAAAATTGATATTCGEPIAGARVGHLVVCFCLCLWLVCH